MVGKDLEKARRDALALCESSMRNLGEAYINALGKLLSLRAILIDATPENSKVDTAIKETVDLERLLQIFESKVCQ